MVTVSVLMSSYNHEKYIAQAIDSVLNQTYEDLELIIVDDCSTDNSRRIIEQYSAKDYRIKASYHTANMGIPTTANDCLKLVTGQYISYIGSDDLWVPTKLEKQLDLLKKSGCKIAWSEALIVNDVGIPTGQTITQLLGATKKRGYLFEHLLREQFVFFQSLIFEAALAKGLKRDHHFKYVSDHRFIVELSRNTEFDYIDEPLAKYRLHGNNITNRKKTEWMRERIALRKLFLEKYGDVVSNQTRADLFHKIGHAYVLLDDPVTAKHYYIKAFEADRFNRVSILYLSLALIPKETQSVTKVYYRTASLLRNQTNTKKA